MTKKRQTIVAIDDDTWITDHYEHVLAPHGYRVVSATNAVDGMMLVDRVQPDVILLDMFMPGPNGVVLLHEIHSHADLAYIPIVVITNGAAELPAVELAAYGVSEVIDKTTMHPDDIVAAVKRAVS